MSQHIDRSEINSSLEKRVEYLTDFIGFGQDDIEALHAAAPLAKPLVQDIVDAVYVKLFSYDITKQSFLPRNNGFEGKTASTLSELTLDSDQIKFRKDFLKIWALKVFTAPYNAETWEYFDKVGIMHTGVAGFKHREKKSPLHVDYVHCAILLGYVQDILISTVLGISEEQVPLELKIRVTRAINKVFWIQNDLFARHYIHDAPAQGTKQATSSLGNAILGLLALTGPLLLGAALLRN